MAGFKKIIKQEVSIWQRTCGFCLLALVFIHFSPALSSISLATGLVFALVGYVNSHSKLNDIPFWLWLLPAFFLYQLLLNGITSGLLFGDADKLLLKLPLLFAPVIFTMGLHNQKIRWGIIVFSLPLAWLTLAGMLNYFNHLAFYNQMVLESKPVPVYSFVYHIEFSLMLSLSCLILIHTLIQNYREVKHDWKLWLISGILIVNVAGLHVLSARTGLLAFWLGMMAVFFTARIRALKSKKVLITFILIVILLALIPSVRNRLVNSWQDLSAVTQHQDLNNKSFGQRWIAWKMSLKAASKKPVAGYGYASVDKALQEEYEINHVLLDKRNRVSPHNQYLESLLQSGWGAVILLVSMFLWASVWSLKVGNVMGFALVIALAAAMFFESILERQAGILCVAVVLPLMAGAGLKQKD